MEVSKFVLVFMHVCMNKSKIMCLLTHELVDIFSARLHDVLALVRRYLHVCAHQTLHVFSSRTITRKTLDC